MIEKFMNKMFLSIVIPVYNEEHNIDILYDEIIEALKNRTNDFEIIFINDGSTDRSFQKLIDLNSRDSRVKVLNFRKNFGQSAAISAGFSHSRGEMIVTLDSDLQNDPADIPMIIEKLQEGNDMVNGWRKKRKDNFFSRRIPSILGNKLISLITGVKLHDYGCTLRGFKRDVIKNLKLYGEMHRYIPAIASRMGIRSVEIQVNHRERKFGKSNYGLGRTMRVILDLISIKYLLSFSHRPLQIFGSLGLFMILIGFISGLYLTYIKYFLNQSANRPLLFFTVLVVFVGFQMITLGLLAEMLARIYHEGLNKDMYSIRDYVGFSDEDINDRSRTVF
jgi:glycosyltransferase involved in cell wall biosynthesis